MFQSIERRPPDPILGLSAAYANDPSPNKIDLGVGVYKDESGNTPIMAAVKQAEQRLWEREDSKSYIAQAGPESYNRHITELILGAGHSALAEGRYCTILAPGGSGALRLAAEFINHNHPGARIWVSDPTWANHVPLLGAAGLNLVPYPYYDYQSHEVQFSNMMAALKDAGRDDLVLLHGCCHNPCGADLGPEQWRVVAEAAAAQGFTPFIDLAYQGLGDGLDQDAHGPRLLARELPELVIASSCSKNFGLYRERVGAVTLVSENAAQADACASQIVSAARELYSMPPAHGAALVALIFEDPALREQWENELGDMRGRLNGLRALLVDKLKSKGVSRDFRFIRRERGLFSFLGLSPEQVGKLVKEYSVYLVNSSRVNVAGINQRNIDYLVDSLAKVLSLK